MRDYRTIAVDVLRDFARTQTEVASASSWILPLTPCETKPRFAYAKCLAGFGISD